MSHLQLKDNLSIYVLTFEGKSSPLRKENPKMTALRIDICSLDESVEEVKEKIIEKENFSRFSELRILYQGKQLKDGIFLIELFAQRKSDM